jgi:hypothetical protein
MMDLPVKNADYGKADYWNQRYTRSISVAVPVTALRL